VKILVKTSSKKKTMMTLNVLMNVKMSWNLSKVLTGMHVVTASGLPVLKNANTVTGKMRTILAGMVALPAGIQKIADLCLTGEKMKNGKPNLLLWTAGCTLILVLKLVMVWKLQVLIASTVLMTMIIWV